MLSVQTYSDFWNYDGTKREPVRWLIEPAGNGISQHPARDTINFKIFSKILKASVLETFEGTVIWSKKAIIWVKASKIEALKLPENLPQRQQMKNRVS